MQTPQHAEVDTAGTAGEVQTVSLNEAARQLGISRTTAWRLDAAGQFPLPVLRMGRLKRVSKDGLRRYLATGEATP